MQHHAVVVDGIADAIDARHGGHNHRVLALQQALGGRQAHLLDVFVDAGILLDIQVARRHVGLRLVVVVVGHEVLDCIVREELAHLGVKLGRECLVGRDDDGRTTQTRDHVGHGKRLARPGDAEQRLVHQPVADALHELVDRLRLVAGRRERLIQPKRAVGENQCLRIGHGVESRRRIHRAGTARSSAGLSHMGLLAPSARPRRIHRLRVKSRPRTVRPT